MGTGLKPLNRFRLKAVLRPGGQAFLQPTRTAMTVHPSRPCRPSRHKPPQAAGKKARPGPRTQNRLRSLCASRGDRSGRFGSAPGLCPAYAAWSPRGRRPIPYASEPPRLLPLLLHSSIIRLSRMINQRNRGKQTPSIRVHSRPFAVPVARSIAPSLRLAGTASPYHAVAPAHLLFS